jgi:hypothetical protein
MEDVRIQGWYTSPPSSRTPYFCGQDVFEMTLIERMVAAGMSRDCAAETAMWYMAQGDDEGLEDYVTALEAGREARQYGVS